MKQTAVEWLITELEKYEKGISEYFSIPAIHNAAYRMEKEQMGYTNEDVLRAGEMGEICYLDTEHIVSYLDEAKHHNETFNKEQQRELLKEMIQADEKDGLYDELDATLNDGIED
jgi:hypothetical protein